MYYRELSRQQVLCELGMELNNALIMGGREPARCRNPEQFDKNLFSSMDATVGNLLEFFPTAGLSGFSILRSLYLATQKNLA